MIRRTHLGRLGWSGAAVKTVLGGGVVLSLFTLLVAGCLLIERLYASTILLLVAVGAGRF
jgi:hypothetical protein